MPYTKDIGCLVQRLRDAPAKYWKLLTYTRRDIHYKIHGRKMSHDADTKTTFMGLSFLFLLRNGVLNLLLITVALIKAFFREAVRGKCCLQEENKGVGTKKEHLNIRMGQRSRSFLFFFFFWRWLMSAEFSERFISRVRCQAVGITGLQSSRTCGQAAVRHCVEPQLYFPNSVVRTKIPGIT